MKEVKCEDDSLIAGLVVGFNIRPHKDYYILAVAMDAKVIIQVKAESVDELKTIAEKTMEVYLTAYDQLTDAIITSFEEVAKEQTAPIFYGEDATGNEDFLK